MAGVASGDLLRWYAVGVRSGRFFAVGFFHGRRMVGVMVLQIGDGPDGKVLTVVAAAGGVRGVDLTATGMRGVEELARRDGFARIRLETSRRGLAQKTALIGYTLACVVMEKELSE